MMIYLSIISLISCLDRNLNESVPVEYTLRLGIKFILHTWCKDMNKAEQLQIMVKFYYQ